MFINSIKYIINDNHLKLQYLILKHSDIKNIKYFINIDNDLSLFENIINYKIPKTNSSICENKLILQRGLF